MMEYKNIKDNKCLYSDTDSLIMEKKLKNNVDPIKLGSFKLVDFIKKGYFPAKKCYAYTNEKGIIKIKQKGLNLNYNKLSLDDFKKLSNGENIVVKNKI